MASQPHVSAPSTTNSQPASSSSSSITKESFLQRARAAALRDKRGSKSPSSSRAQSPAGSLHGQGTTSHARTNVDTSAQAQPGENAHLPGEGAPRYGSILNTTPSWSVARDPSIAPSGAAEPNQSSAPPLSSPTTEAMELDELQDLKADHRHSSPDSVEFIQETGPTQRRRPPLVSSASAPAQAASTDQPAPAPATSIVPLNNFAQDSPSAAVDAQLELPGTDAEATSGDSTAVLPEVSAPADASVLPATSGRSSDPSRSADPSQPALYGDPSPLLPLIQSFPPDCRRIAIRSFETLPEDIRRKVLGSTSMMDNFKAYVLTNVVPAQQPSTTPAEQQATVSDQQQTITPAQQQTTAIARPQSTDSHTSTQPVDTVPTVSMVAEQQQVQPQQQVQQQTQSSIADQLSLPQKQPSMAFTGVQTQSPVIQQPPVVQSPLAFQQSSGLPPASALSPVIVQSTPQQYGSTVPPLLRQRPLDRSGQPTTTTTSSTALTTTGAMENRLGAWTQGL